MGFRFRPNRNRILALGRISAENFGSVSFLLKSPIFVVQKAATPKIGVEFRQGSNGTIRSSLATQYDVAGHRATSRDLARRSQTTSDGTIRTLAKFYPIFWCGSLLYNKNDDFRASLMWTSLTTWSTHSSKRRSLGWPSLKRQIMEVIEVDQLEEKKNERLS